MATFDDIVRTTMERLNLTSDDARERIGERVNCRYAEICSSIGLFTSRRSDPVVMVIDPTDVINFPDLPVLTTTDLSKITRIQHTIGGNIRVLKERTYDEITNVQTIRAVPKNWAVKRVGSHEVTFILDAYPEEEFTLNLEGYDITVELEDDAEPFFPEDFHDALVEGAMADELFKMEKANLAIFREQKYKERISDLRMFLAKSAYLDIIQGRNKPSTQWYRQWASRIGYWN